MRATESLAPIQLGVGVSGGVEMKFAAVRTAHECGMVVAAWDVVNAFFSVRREQMFMAVAHKVPEVYGNLSGSRKLDKAKDYDVLDRGTTQDCNSTSELRNGFVCSKMQSTA